MAAILEQIPQHANRAIHTAHATFEMAAHGQLVRSRLNVRQKGKDSIEELAALIASQGLLQNLIGYRQFDNGAATGVIEVVAGWRRTCAIGSLIKAGELPFDYEIPVLIVPEEEAIAISLAENSGREPMHHADVLDAMLALAKRAVSAADIAIAFGVSELTVRRRLKLANVAPRFVAMYRDDKLKLDQMEALALIDDHATQEQAWDSLDQWSRTAHHLRRLLTSQRVDAKKDRVALYVGLKAYEAASGSVTRDLFSDCDQGYIDDGSLLDRLASAKLDKVAKKLEKEGWQWIEVRVRTDRAYISQYARVRTAQRDPDDSEAAQLEALDARILVANDRIDDMEDDDSEWDAVQEQLDKDQDARERLGARLQRPLDSDMALAGALVTLDDEGKVTVLRGLIRAADKSRMERPSNEHCKGKSRRQAGAHSERLTLALTAHRTAALQAVVAERPDIALAALVAKMVGGVFSDSAEPSVVQVSLKHRALQNEAADLVSSKAWTVLEEKHAAWEARLPEDGAAFDWLCKQPQSVTLDLLAFCVAWSMDAVSSNAAPSSAFVALAKASGLDMADWWKPTRAGYFDHIPKRRIVDVVTQALSAADAQPLLAAKKEVVCDAAERALANARWMPPEFRLD